MSKKRNAAKNEGNPTVAKVRVKNPEYPIRVYSSILLELELKFYFNECIYYYEGSKE